MRAVLHEKLHNPCVVRKDIRRPRLDFSEHRRVKILDGVRHMAMFSHLRTLINLWIVKPIGSIVLLASPHLSRFV